MNDANHIGHASGGRFTIRPSEQFDGIDGIDLVSVRASSDLLVARHYRATGTHARRMLEQLQRAVGVLSRIETPGAPRMIDLVHRAEGDTLRAWLLETYTPGKDLGALFDAGQPFTVGDGCRIVHDVLTTLSFLHTCDPPIMHGHIRPDTIRIRHDGNVMLTDPHVIQALRHTERGRGASHGVTNQLTPASDLVGAGELLLQLLTGRAPVDFPTVDGRLQLGDTIPGGENIRAALHGLLNATTDQGFDSATVALEALANLVSQYPSKTQGYGTDVRGELAANAVALKTRRQGPRFGLATVAPGRGLPPVAPRTRPTTVPLVTSPSSPQPSATIPPVREDMTEPTPTRPTPKHAPPLSQEVQASSQGESTPQPVPTPSDITTTPVEPTPTPSRPASQVVPQVDTAPDPGSWVDAFRTPGDRPTPTIKPTIKPTEKPTATPTPSPVAAPKIPVEAAPPVLRPQLQPVWITSRAHRRAIASDESLFRDGLQVALVGDDATGKEVISGRAQTAMRGMAGFGADWTWRRADLLVAEHLSPWTSDTKEGGETTRAENTALRTFLSGQHQDALKQAEQTSAEDTDNVTQFRAAMIEGVVRLGFEGGDTTQTDTTRALAAFQRAAKLAETPSPLWAAQALTAAGYCLRLLNQHAEALATFDKAIATAANLFEASYQRSLTLMALDRPDDAFPQLFRAAALDRGYLLRASVDAPFSDDADLLVKEARHAVAHVHAKIAPRIRTQIASLKLPKTPLPVAQKAMSHMTDFITLGESWPMYDVLQLTAERENMMHAATQGRVRDGSQRRAQSTQLPTNAYSEARSRKERKRVRRKVVVKPRTWHSREVVEWRNEEEVVETTERQNHKRTRLEVRIDSTDGKTVASCDLISLNAGTFLMGSPSEEPGRKSDETQHEVTLSHTFFLGLTPVTQRQWLAVTGENPSFFKGEERPVERVSWLDAVRFCNALSRLEGLPEAYIIKEQEVHWRGLSAEGYRLPTEAEWEYACRCASTTAYAHGDTLTEESATFKGEEVRGTVPVQTHPSSEWGYYAVHGNVWEWCWDRHAPYAADAVTDPIGPEKGTQRVAKGGAWSSDVTACRSASRLVRSALEGGPSIGLRLARTLLP
jgi:formylglycine-generating enzyme required for sulfatase activity/tetratricopeptide (TPR) repeat protein